MGRWGTRAVPADERAPVNPTELVAWRPAHEQRVLETASAGVRAIVVRPGIVYGGGRGIVGDLLKDASNGLVRVVGTGENHWPLVYDRDLGELYARLVNTPDRRPASIHANDEGDETVNAIVAALAEHASIRAERPARADRRGAQEDGTVRRCAGARSDRAQPARAELGWNPTLHSVAGNVARLFEEWRRAVGRQPGM